MTLSSKRANTCLRSIILLAAPPLLWDYEVLVQNVCRNVIQVLLLHSAHLWPDVSCPDGWMHFRDVLQAIVSRWAVQVVNHAFNVVALWLCAREFFPAQTYVLIGACATADVAIRTRCNKEALTTDDLFFCKIHCFALSV